MYVSRDEFEQKRKNFLQTKWLKEAHKDAMLGFEERLILLAKEKIASDREIRTYIEWKSPHDAFGQSVSGQNFR